ncbi:MAG: hypothetical protein PHO68_08810 [Lascolabacillus sp.]|uniref:hypothetical protein n=1 Tax=Lascolabacillus sp. TaxID=1924068 RepID=UPI0025850C40|nr:hypothetical protein [Lascolabacillus sp.]MDD4759012.1 hypothetical protein [Lascolabacillus sp.]
MIYNITFTERLDTKTGNFQSKNETGCAMFMLYESMAWTCLFRSSGIPVPRVGAV